MRYGKSVAAIASVAAVLVFAGDMASGGGRGGMFRHVGDTNGGGDGNKDIAVRQVTVTPVRAHVGDTVRVDVVIENKAEGYETIPLEIIANRKVVARKLFTFGWSPAERIYRETFTWNTRGVSPGEYRIRAEAFVWGDSSPSDNFLKVKEVLLLSAPGTPLPDGATSGGSATETDPRFVNRMHRDGGESTGEAGPAGGY
ncbi:hypothetical protein [Candidatus Deferrimicrobium sp.]|uniref:hypothetical protein n=1 Tax=Candidatus Deferrimicrobium sp. TaxID=3060586 RepID=UPI002717BB13|nr:hypothetical protein [Candidatus Deferrimicrobium sp.]MDO8738347.1 hypothetical protein [Candidatus Deferrimicrobium sp.]